MQNKVFFGMGTLDENFEFLGRLRQRDIVLQVKDGKGQASDDRFALFVQDGQAKVTPPDFPMVIVIDVIIATGAITEEDARVRAQADRTRVGGMVPFPAALITAFVGLYQHLGVFARTSGGRRCGLL